MKTFNHDTVELPEPTFATLANTINDATPGGHVYIPTDDVVRV